MALATIGQWDMVLHYHKWLCSGSFPWPRILAWTLYCLATMLFMRKTKWELPHCTGGGSGGCRLKSNPVRMVVWHSAASHHHVRQLFTTLNQHQSEVVCGEVLPFLDPDLLASSESQILRQEHFLYTFTPLSQKNLRTFNFFRSAMLL